MTDNSYGGQGELLPAAHPQLHWNNADRRAGLDKCVKVGHSAILFC